MFLENIPASCDKALLFWRGCVDEDNGVSINNEALHEIFKLQLEKKLVLTNIRSCKQEKSQRQIGKASDALLQRHVNAIFSPGI